MRNLGARAAVGTAVSGGPAYGSTAVGELQLMVDTTLPADAVSSYKPLLLAVKFV